jgi:uncharacterized membrane protein
MDIYRLFKSFIQGCCLLNISFFVRHFRINFWNMQNENNDCWCHTRIFSGFIKVFMSILLFFISSAGLNYLAQKENTCLSLF